MVYTLDSLFLTKQQQIKKTEWITSINLVIFFFINSPKRQNEFTHTHTA